MNKAKNIKGFCAKAEKYISGLKEIFGEQGGFFQNKSFQKKNNKRDIESQKSIGENSIKNSVITSVKNRKVLHHNFINLKKRSFLPLH